MNLKTELVEIEAKKESLLDRISQILDSLPENQRIRRLDSKCFIIRFKDLGSSNWSPFYHDFRAQYSKVAEILKSSDLSVMSANLTQIVDRGSLYFRGENLKFHPEVREYLREALCGPK
jgi:hypothetical protein